MTYQRKRKPGGGRKPSCTCGTCAKCRQVASSKRSYYRRAMTNEIDDNTLEQRMINMFKQKGWDK